ncbi:MauE/DoxX family redox-associated membrane protein [Nonomuraea sp. NPDC002799]
MTSVALALRLVLAVVCLVAAVTKLSGRGSFAAFVGELAAVGIAPRMCPPVAMAIVVAEVTVAALAPWPATGLAGAVIASGLMIALTAGVAHSVRRGSPARCRCFGSGGGRLTRVHVVRNTGLTGVAVLAVAMTAAVSRQPLDPVGVGIAATAAGLAASLVIFFEDVAALVRR